MYIVKGNCNKIFLKTTSFIKAVCFLFDNFYYNNSVRIYKNGKCLK